MSDRALGLLGLAARAGALTIGTGATRAGLQRGDVRLVVLAGNRSARTAEKVEKHNSGSPDYQAPEKLLKLHEAKDFGAFKEDSLNDVPVAMLYNADTTGGNSGSPRNNFV